MAKNILTEAKKDKDIKQIVKKAAEKDSKQDPDELYDSFVKTIDTALESIKEAEAPDFSFKYYTWVNNTGDIVGLSFKTDELSFSYFAPDSGRKLARQIKIVSGGNTIELEGSGKRSGNKVDIKYTLSVMDTKILVVDFSDFDTKKFEEGYPNGSVSIAPSQSLVSLISGSGSGAPSWVSLLKGLKIKLDMETTEKVVNYKLSVLSDSDLMFAFKVGGEEISGENVKAPSTSIDSNNNTAMQNWFSSIDINSFIKGLEDAGIPSDLFKGSVG